MRHDPAGASIVIMLRSLKLYGMANAVEDLVTQGAPAFEAATPMLSQLLKAEMAEREVRSIAYHTKAARFPAYKDLTGFDFASSEINEAKVRQLHRCEFIENAENVVLIGGPSSIGLEPMAPQWTIMPAICLRYGATTTTTTARTRASTGSPRGSITNGQKRTKSRTEPIYKSGFKGEQVSTRRKKGGRICCRPDSLSGLRWPRGQRTY